jgi:hypothetical protein
MEKFLIFKTYFKETVAPDDFLTIPSYSKYRIRNLNFIFILDQLQMHLAYLESAPTYEDFVGLILQPCEMAYYIRALLEKQNAI